MTKVLIVEDEPLVARMYEKALVSDGFEVLISLGGEKAVFASKDFKPDIILMDVMMPGINGVEALLNLKNDPLTSSIPVVMLTNLSGTKDAEIAKSKGAVDYWVKKDIKPRGLGEMIREIINKQTKTTY